MDQVDTIVVGGGQAGLAASAHLSQAGIDHLVLEKGRLAESWRSRRWDSLVANGPAWHDRFPDRAFDGDPDRFAPKEDVADYFAAFAQQIKAPVRCGVEVTRAVPRVGGFAVETSDGPVQCRRIVVATGAFQVPLIPPVVPESAPVAQLHSAAYRNPQALPEGGVLVVGAGASGAQIAEDLRAAGRRVWLSVGPHHRPPRRYRGLDYCWWLGVLGKWDAPAPAPDTAHLAIAVSGVEGGKTVDFRALARDGITLLGMTESYAAGVMCFAGDLAANIADGDANYLSVLDEADAYVAAYGLDLPEDREARQMLPDPDCVTQPIRELDLAREGISTVLWATGYGFDYRWLEVDCFDAQGAPVHQRGVGKAPGVYFLGLPWLSRRGSSFIWGVWHDARHIADQIAIQRGYEAYAARPAAE